MMKMCKKLLSVFLAVMMTLSTMTAAFEAFASEDLSGKTVIVYTSNLRGDIEKLSKIASVKKDYESKGAGVILADTGNFLQGSVYASADRGYTVFTLMEKAGYDLVALGKYDFAFGNAQMGAKPHGTLKQYLTLSQLLNGGETDTLSKEESSILSLTSNREGANANFTFTGRMASTSETDGLTFKGYTDVDTPNNVIEDSIAGITFSTLTSVKEEGKFVICLSNVSGIESDLTIAPSSETFEIGAYVIDEEKNVTSETVDLSSYEDAVDVKAAVDAAKAEIDQAFPEASLAVSEVTLNGSQKDVRSKETNLGDLWCDALLHYGLTTELSVPNENVVAIWNGGNLRDYIYEGNIAVQDVHKVLPYPNTAAVAYIKGSDLLEALEAAQQYDAAFASVAGMEYTIKSYLPFEGGEEYADSKYLKPLSERVEIKSVNGKAFDENATYAVVTSNFIFNGGDTYQAFKNKVEGANSAVSSVKVVDIVWDYIKHELGGTITSAYAEPQGRITIIDEAPEEPDVPFEPTVPEPHKNVPVLKKTAVKKLKKGKKSFTVTWKRISAIKGYQLQYSTSKKFAKKKTKTITVKSAKTTKRKVKKLKSKKTYYVRIRTYKVVDGKKYYSDWSKVKKVKVR